MNDYKREGLRWLRRAAAVIPLVDPTQEDWLQVNSPSQDEIDDSILFFAFGVEKLLKGVLHEINPLFIYENTDIEKMAGVLYRDKMTEGLGKAFDTSKKKWRASFRVHTGSTSLTHAKHFSQVACDYTSTLVTLFEERGAVAHQVPSNMSPDALKLVQKHFSPITEAFIAELNLDPSQIYAEERRKALREMCEQIESKDQFADKQTQLVETHLGIWRSRESKDVEIELATAKTKLVLTRDPGSDRFYCESRCPACEQCAVLLCEVDGEYVDGEAVVTGAFVVQLDCMFCGIKLEGHEQIDYFHLDQQLYAS